MSSATLNLYSFAILVAMFFRGTVEIALSMEAILRECF